MLIAQCLYSTILIEQGVQHGAYGTVLQDNLRCFGVNYDVSRITRFSCYFLSLKLASVLSYYAFPSLVLFSWSGLWCFCNSGYYKKERQLCVGRVRMQSRPFWHISHAAWIRTRPAGQRKISLVNLSQLNTGETSQQRPKNSTFSGWQTLACKNFL